MDFSQRLAGVTIVVLAAVAQTSAHANGTITGTIKLEGPPRTPVAMPVGKDASVCGNEVPSEVLLVGANGGLKNVVVAVTTVKRVDAAPQTPNAFVDQVKCRYTPHVQAVTVGTKLSLVNNDAVFHNVHGTLADGQTAVTAFNVAMPFKGQKLPTTIKRPGVISLRCDAGHTWMSAWVRAFDHAAFAVTDAQGHFTIENVAPGTHTLELWHEPLDGKGSGSTRTVPVTVTDGKTAVVEAALTP